MIVLPFFSQCFCTHSNAGVFDAPALSQCKTVLSYREFYSFFALLLRTTYYRLFHGLPTFAFARGFLSPSRAGRFAPSRWYSPRRLGYSVSRRRSHVSDVRASTAITVYTINTNLLSFVSIRFTEKKHFSCHTSREFAPCAVSQTSFQVSKKCKV